MFEQIYVEEQIASHPRTLRILSAFRNSRVTAIDKVDSIFGKVRKPYLQKRTNLNLFIGEKRGELIKTAPNAYGLGDTQHYYFVHAYNCMFECEYCFLQGYFSSPDLVLFINHEEICAAIEEICERNERKTIWFHAGEFSDNLALSNVTGEWHLYWETFKKHPHAFLELRSKAHNVRALEDLEPLANVVPSFTISPEAQAKKYDHGCPPVVARLKAAAKLAGLGYRLGIHFDPVIYADGFESAYEELVQMLLANLDASQIRYISIGAVRFSKDVFAQLKNNYPRSPILAQEFKSGFDGKMRYSRPMRMWMLKSIEEICIKNGIAKDKIYLCMEDVASQC